MSKLEELMDKRAADNERGMKAASKVYEAAEKKRERAHRLWVRKEFNRLFKRLKTLVTGHWDRYGWGWKFQYKNHDYWISYDHWFSPKYPGDADDYDMSGNDWVLKPHFNASGSDAITLHERKGHEIIDTELSEAVMDGLRELKSKGKYGV